MPALLYARRTPGTLTETNGGHVLFKYCISDLTIAIIAPEWALHENLKIFVSESENVDVSCSVFFQKRIKIPDNQSNPIVKTSGTSIYETDGVIYNISGDEKDIPASFVLSENYSVCSMYLDPEYNDPNDPKLVQCVREGILVTLRDVMIVALSQKQGLIIHSSTIIWNGEGIVFSAPSGTGKSTHTNLWNQLYGTQILDGDATACRIMNGIPVVYGLPWCGTSGQFLNQSVPLKAIVFLQQSKENKIEKLSFQEAFIRLTSRCFLLPWNDKMMKQFLDIIQEVANKTDCYLLNCLPDYNAVELVKTCLE